MAENYYRKQKKFWNSQNSKPLTTKGRSLEELQREEEAKRISEIQTREELLKMANFGERDSFTRKKFVLVQFSTHYNVKDVVVPAEGAMLEFSIRDGLEKERHWFLRPGDLPLGS